MQVTADAPTTARASASFQHVRFDYPDRTALDDISLEVPGGSIFGLLGPNGSGKSTLLALLTGLRQPTAGSVSAFGRPCGAHARSSIGFVFQESSLDQTMTVRESLWLHGRLYGMGGGELRSALKVALGTVGLADRERSLVSTLSGGMKRRLEIARALLPGPRLLVLDEPTTGLDPEFEAAVWEHLLGISLDGVTVLLATNKVSEADRFCTRVAFVHNGRLVAEGDPAELKSGLKHDGVWVEGDFDAPLVESVRSWPDVGRLTWAPPILHATVDDASTFVPRLFQAAAGAIRSIRLREATLEDAYFDLAGVSLTNGSAFR